MLLARGACCAAVGVRFTAADNTHSHAIPLQRAEELLRLSCRNRCRINRLQAAEIAQLTREIAVARKQLFSLACSMSLPSACNRAITRCTCSALSAGAVSASGAPIQA